MALPFIVDSLDSVEESSRALYVQDGEKFRLDLDGYEDPAGLKTALQRERDANKDAKNKLKEAEQFAKQFDGLDVDAVKALLTKAGQDEETRLIAEGKIDQVLEKRTERLRTDTAKQLDAANARAAAAEDRANRFDQKVLADSIRSAALKTGALPEATEDIILRARSTFKLNENGDAVAYDGNEPIYGKDGKTPLTLAEWAESLKETAPHLWPRPTGGGPMGDKGARHTSKGNIGGTKEERTAAFASKFPELNT